jgi:hypothetical protein
MKKQRERINDMHAAVDRATANLAANDAKAAKLCRAIFDHTISAIPIVALMNGVDGAKLISGLCYLFVSLDQAADKGVAEERKVNLN